MTSGTTTTNEDWRYSDARMKLRQEVYTILLKKFGAELNEHGAPVHLSLIHISEPTRPY